MKPSIFFLISFIVSFIQQLFIVFYVHGGVLYIGKKGKTIIVFYDSLIANNRKAS